MTGLFLKCAGTHFPGSAFGLFAHLASPSDINMSDTRLLWISQKTAISRTEYTLRSAYSTKVRRGWIDLS